MKKILIILAIIITSCSKDNSIDEDNGFCNCTKVYYSFKDENVGSVIKRELVGCVAEVEPTILNVNTYYTIECN